MPEDEYISTKPKTKEAELKNAFIDLGVKKKEIFVSTGIEKLDRLLEGGVPRGFTVLILGTPGSSTEIMTKQLATSGKTLYFTTEETKDEILETMKRFGWNIPEIDFVDISSKYYQRVLTGDHKRVSIYEQRSKLKLKELIAMGSTGIPTTKVGEEDFLAVLSDKITRSTPDKIIIYSLDFFLSQYPQEEVLKTIYVSKISNLQNRGALFIIMTKGVHGEILERKMEGMADCVLELDVIQKGSAFERFLSVKKNA